MPSVGIARSAPSSVASGAVTNVGWNAVVPVASSASPDARVAVVVGGHQVDAREAVDLQVDEARRGDARRRSRAASPTASITPSVDRDVAPESSIAVDQRGSRRPASSLHRPGGARRHQVLARSTNTIATGSV